MSAQEAGGQDNAEARAILEQAQQLYEDGQYALAAERYLEFHRRLIALGNPRAPLALWNTGLALSHLPGREAEALRTLQQFITDSHVLNDDPEVRDMRSEAQVKIAELEARTPHSGSDTISPVGPILLGIGAAAVVVGIITGAVALTDGDQLRADCGGGVCPDSARDRVASVEMLSGVTDGLLFAGAAIAVVGLVLTVVLRERPSQSPAPVTAGCGLGGCAVVVHGVFK